MPGGPAAGRRLFYADRFATVYGQVHIAGIVPAVCEHDGNGRLRVFLRGHFPGGKTRRIVVEVVVALLFPAFVRVFEGTFTFCRGGCIHERFLRHVVLDFGNDGVDDHRVRNHRVNNHGGSTVTCEVNGRLLQVLYRVGQVVAQVRRLVVGHVLPGDTHAVVRVVHQGVHAVIRLDRSAENRNHGSVAAGAQNKFFAPVTEQVGHEARVLLCSVVRGGLVHVAVGEVAVRLLVLGAPLVYCTVKQFVLQVAVEIDAEVHRGLAARNLLALHVLHSVARAAPHLESAMVRVNVCGEASAVVDAWVRLLGAPDDLAVGAAEIVGVGDGLFFVNVPRFKARAVGVHVRKVECVAVPEPRAVKERTVGLERRRTEHDFVLAVAVDVAHGNVMVTFAEDALAPRFGLVVPTLFELLAVEVVGDRVGVGVVAAHHHEARVYTVEVGDGREHAFTAIAVGVAPVLGDAPARHVVDGRDGRTGFTVEHGQELVPAHDGTGLCAVILALVADDLARTVDRAVACLHGDFGDAVAVQVVDHELRVMGARADVLAQVDAPQLFAVHLVAVNIHVARVAALRVVLLVARVPLYDKFEFPVAVQVAHAHVVRGVAAAGTVGHLEVAWAVKLEGRVRNVLAVGTGRLVEHEREPGLRAFLAVHDCGDRILGGRLARSVEVVCCTVPCDDRNFCPVAVKIELGIRGVAPEQAPADQHAVPDVCSHETAAQVFHLPGRRECLGGHPER